MLLCKITRYQFEFHFIYFFFQDGKIVSVYTSEEKLRSKFDFTWYPFDTQEFVLPTVLGMLYLSSKSTRLGPTSINFSMPVQLFERLRLLATVILEFFVESLLCNVYI